MAPLRTIVVTALSLGRAWAGPGPVCDGRGGAVCGDEEAPSLLQLQEIRAHEHAMKPSLLVGGWCQGALHDPKTGAPIPCTWGSEATVILPGGFMSSAATLPNPKTWQGKAKYQEVWLTLGGSGVGNADPDKCFSASFIATSAKELDATGVCFDMEGCYRGQLTKLKQTIAEVKKISKTLQFMFTPLGDGPTTPYVDLEDTFDALSPMLYWGSKSYQPKPGGNGITCDMIKSWAKNWVNAGWLQAKTYLTYQSESAHESPAIITSCLKEFAESSGYKGLLGWPVSPPTPAIDHANLALIVGGGPAPPTLPAPPQECKAHCTGGRANGQCCDKDRTTTLGSCNVLGQEACCGGTGKPPYYCKK